MRKNLSFIAAALLLAAQLHAQLEPDAGNWKTWFISSGKEYRLAPPPAWKTEIAEVLSRQKNLDSAGRQQIIYWNAGAPGYRWQPMMFRLWMSDTTYNGALAYMLLGTATYDATVAAWDTKYALNRSRPFAADSRVKVYAPKPESPSFPCEHSVAAGVAVALISHFYPAMADSARHMADRLMASRVAAGVAFPSDTRAGFELGKTIAEIEIAKTKTYTPQMTWDGKQPEGPVFWRGEAPAAPLAGRSKTVALDSSSQFRPGPPPDYAKDMAELRNFKPSFGSMANAYFFGSQPFWEDLLHKKVFEYNLHLNPPRAARVYALAAIAYYDGFVSCWDAKYTYWGIRPEQYDTTFQPVLFQSPPFPGYPSGHAAISGVLSELYSYFFPAESAYFRRKAKDAAESRFQGGIHFRTDNEVGLEMGRKVGDVIIRKAKADGADKAPAEAKTASAGHGKRTN